MSNPLNLRLNSPQGGVITCIANASYYQEVQIQFPDLPLVVFQGTGEEVPMRCDTGNVFSIPSSHSDCPISLTFLYSTNGSQGPFNLAYVKPPIINQEGDFVTITVMSEDSTDNDNNDTYLTINYLQQNN